MRHLVELYLPKNIVETVPQITTDELNVINQTRPFKSSPNDLPPIVFQKLSTENKLVVKQFFNVCLLCPYFPAKWKRAILRILRKPDKTLLYQHKSYRPISILPVLGKWFGKIIPQRLLWHQNTNNWISQKQFGFQPGKSCSEFSRKNRSCI